MRIVLLLLLIYGFTPIPKNLRYKTRNELAKKMDAVSRKQSALINNTEINGLKLENIRLKKELKKRTSLRQYKPQIGEKYERIRTFERFSGHLEGNIVSTGTVKGFKIILDDHHKLPSGSYVACSGRTLTRKYNYRIIGECHSLIGPERTYKIEARVKDTKHIEGLEADDVHTGGEEALIGEGVTAILAKKIDNSKDRVLTDRFIEAPTDRNIALNGAFEMAKSANNMAKNHTKNMRTIVVVKHGKKAIIEFVKEFNYED